MPGRWHLRRQSRTSRARRCPSCPFEDTSSLLLRWAVSPTRPVRAARTRWRLVGHPKLGPVHKASRPISTLVFVLHAFRCPVGSGVLFLVGRPHEHCRSQDRSERAEQVGSPCGGRGLCQHGGGWQRGRGRGARRRKGSGRQWARAFGDMWLLEAVTREGAQGAVMGQSGGS